MRPNVEEFHTNFADLRRAFNAVGAIDALAAHIYVGAVWAGADVVGARDDSAYRDHLAQQNEPFAWVRDVAKAQKHVHLTRGEPRVRRADQMVARQIGWGEGPYGAGRYDGVEQVMIEIAGGDFAYLENVVDEAMDFLERKMTALGV